MQWALQTLGRASVEGDAELLDVGCGDGKITAALAEATTGAVLGIDRSPEMISYAQRWHQNSEHKNLSFCVGRAEEFVPENRVDVITSFTALHWVPDHNKLLRHFASILFDGGALVLQFPGHGNAAELTDSAFQVMDSPPWKPYFQNFTFPWSLFTPSEYEKLLRRSGFRPQELELLPQLMTHEGGSGLAAWMKTTWLPFTARVPLDQQSAFLSDIVNHFLARQPEQERGSVTTRMKRLHVIARKSETQADSVHA